MEEKKRIFRRLSLSALDLSFAKKYVNHIIENELYNQDNKKLINRGLQIAAIISYSRPFSGNYNFEHTIGRLPDEHLMGLTEKETDLHKEILDLRNKAIAHTDADEVDLKVSIKEMNGLKMAMPISRKPFIPFSEQKWKSFKSVIEKVDASVSSEIIDYQKEFELGEKF